MKRLIRFLLLGLVLIGGHAHQFVEADATGTKADSAQCDYWYSEYVMCKMTEDPRNPQAPKENCQYYYRMWEACKADPDNFK